MGDEQKKKEKRSSPIFTASCKVLKNFRRAPKKIQGRKNRDPPRATLALAAPLHGAPNFFGPGPPIFLIRPCICLIKILIKNFNLPSISNVGYICKTKATSGRVNNHTIKRMKFFL